MWHHFFIFGNTCQVLHGCKFWDDSSTALTCALWCHHLGSRAFLGHFEVEFTCTCFTYSTFSTANECEAWNQWSHLMRCQWHSMSAFWEDWSLSSGSTALPRYSIEDLRFILFISACLDGLPVSQTIHVHWRPEAFRTFGFSDKSPQYEMLWKPGQIQTGPTSASLWLLHH